MTGELDQYDLFGQIEAAETTQAAADRHAKATALHVLAWHFPNTLALLADVDAWVTARDGRNLDLGGETKASYSGAYAYSPTRKGLHVERGDTWGGWTSRPRHLITWADLRDLIATHPDQHAELLAHADWMLHTDVPDAWRDLVTRFDDRWLCTPCRDAAWDAQIDAEAARYDHTRPQKDTP